MNKIRALIVDDEYPAREELRYYLNKIEDIVVVGEAADTKEALILLNALEYDVVFLDISFPNSNGIDVGKDISNFENPPAIIYITAYEQYAYQAFEVNAIDYILKPIEESKLNKAIDKLRNQREKNSYNKIEKKKSDKKLTKISAENNGKIVLLNIEEIYYAFTRDTYVFIKTYDKEFITRYTLSSLEDKIDSNSFFRTHRSFIVNFSKIKEVLPFFKGTYNLVLKDKEESNIPVSRRQSAELKKILDL